MTADEREELLCYYLSGLGGPSHGEARTFRAIYLRCAMQRLMQALGAYGKLGYVDGKTAFLEHIPMALASLKMVLREIPQLDRLGNLLASLPESSPAV